AGRRWTGGSPRRGDDRPDQPVLRDPGARRTPLVSGAASRTIVLVHGAGHTADVWRAVQEHTRHPTVAFDLPGRRDRPAPIAEVTIDDAATSLAADVERAADGRVVLVGHSAGGVVLPALAARLGERVDH